MANAVVLTRGSIEFREDFAEELMQLFEDALTEPAAEFTLAWDEAQLLFAPRAYELPLAHAGAA